MKNLIILLFTINIFITSCGTDYNFIDTGTANPYFDGNMYEYLQSGSYNWDSIVKIIDKANLKNIFEEDNVTFIGVTNHSIRRWLIAGGYGYETLGYKCIDDIPVEMCKSIVLSHVIDGKMMRDEIERATFNELGVRNGGGRTVTTLNGNKMILWTKQTPYMGMPGMGPVELSMTALKPDGKTEISTNRIASADILPFNGVVHSLQYSYKLEDLDLFK